MRNILGLILSLVITAGSFAKPVVVKSPDARISVSVDAKDGAVVYSVLHDGVTIMDGNRAAMDIVGVKPVTKLGSTKYNKVKRKVDAQFYRFSSFVEEYNEAVISLNNGMSVAFRAYNDGVAYRFSIKNHKSTNQKSLIINDETAEFAFAKDGESWLSYSTNEKNQFAMAFQNIYSHKNLSAQPDSLAFLPVTIDCGTCKVTLTESDLEAYPGMFLRPCKENSSTNHKSTNHKLSGVFAKYPKAYDKYPWRQQLYVTETEDYIAKRDLSIINYQLSTAKGQTFPWRVMAITVDDTQLPENNLVYALASPSRIGDTSWIKPGKVAWDWWNDWGLKGVPFKAGINVETYKYYIDFASEHGLQYIILDEGWYESKKGDIMNPIAEINLPELIAYGKKKNVDIVLWAVFNVLDEKLEEACKIYSEMGIKGFKVDFMDRDDQTAVEMAYRIAEVCAKHHLMLDYHGFYKPTGFNRTFPNIVNVEAVFGMEEVKWNEDKKDMPLYDVTFPFIRMMCGPVDYTPGAMHNASKADYQPIYYNPMSMGTRAHQVATYIVHDTPFTMLADSPTNYKNEEETVQFIASLPDVPEETRCLQGKIGEYIVTARRVGESWYVGGLTNWNERDIVLPLSFLADCKTYSATIYKDGINANKNAEDYVLETIAVTSSSTLSLHLAEGGGFAIKFVEK